MPKRQKQLNIMIVEDDSLIATYLASLLEELGHTVVASAARVEKALVLAKTGDIDLAILDVSVAGVSSFPVADIFRARGIPFFFTCTEKILGRNDLYRDELILKKPYFLNDLVNIIAHVFSTREDSTKKE